MKKSNYALYIEEREGKFIVEDERGFATYLFLPEHCYIEDIFVQEAFREHYVATEYADQIAKLAKAKGYSKLLGSVCTQAKGATASIKILIGYGFKVLNSEKNMIYFEKNI